MTKLEFVWCSVIKHRGDLRVLYLLKDGMENVRQLHGKKVYVIIIPEE